MASGKPVSIEDLTRSENSKARNTVLEKYAMLLMAELRENSLLDDEEIITIKLDVYNEDEADFESQYLALNTKFEASFRQV